MDSKLTSSRKEHKDCRLSQVSKNATAKSKCDKLDTRLSDFKKQMQFSGSESREDLLAYVKKVSDLACSQKGTFDQSAAECNAANKDDDTAEKDCYTKQATFENFFCTYRTAVTDVCSNTATCYDSALKDY